MQPNDPLDKLKQAESDTEEIDALRQMAEPLAAKAPKETLVERATALFRQRIQQARERKTLSADLQFDSWNGSIALGMRNGAISDRQLLFQHDDIEIDIQIVPIAGSDRANVQGQIMTEKLDLAGIELRLLEPSGHERARITDELGEFTFSYCTFGDYSLSVALQNGVLVSQFTINTQSNATE